MKLEVTTMNNWISKISFLESVYTKPFLKIATKLFLILCHNLIDNNLFDGCGQ